MKVNNKLPKVFKHLMLDIETLGTKSYSTILSIGAVEFDIETGETGKEFYVNIDPESCEKYGLKMDVKTVMWWMKQNQQAREDLVAGEVTPLPSALFKFTEFCNENYEVWGNSARFDCGILQNAYEKIGSKVPWDFRKERDVRTLVSFMPEVKETFAKGTTAHNALSDCYYQIGYCSKIWNTLKSVTND